MKIARAAQKPGLARWPGLGLIAAAISCPSLAQSSASTGADPGVTLKPVEVIGVATDDTEDRRLSTAAKIIVGRDDIEHFGDSTVGELLKRLPGITMQGRPGRGGAPRMRGLGGGYTQILVDGERVPRGFSLDDLSPEQIERIEILRAPTAETGATPSRQQNWTTMGTSIFEPSRRSQFKKSVVADTVARTALAEA